MLDTPPPLPAGDSQFHNWARWVQRRLGALRTIDTPDSATNRTTRGVSVVKKKGGTGGSGFGWQTPMKELDPTVTVSANTFVYISPQNPLATVGLTDLVSATIMQATPGIWQALLAVPAKTASGYHVPQDPPIGSGGEVPSGSPLEGDLDGDDEDTVYWLLWKSVC
jgi:hypothetical protein